MHIHNVGAAMSKKYRNTSVVKNRTSAFSNQEGRCFYCNQPMWVNQPESFCNQYRISLKAAQLLKCTAEHVIARKDGGSNQRNNIVAACMYCNKTRHKAKNALSVDKYKARVIQRMGQNKWHPIRVC